MKLTFILFAFIINFFNPYVTKAEEIIDSSNNQIEKNIRIKSANDEILAGSYTHLTLPPTLVV